MTANNKIIIIKDNENEMYYRRLALRAFDMVDKPEDATHFNYAGAYETIEFLSAIGSDVVGVVHYMDTDSP